MSLSQEKGKKAGSSQSRAASAKKNSTTTVSQKSTTRQITASLKGCANHKTTIEHVEYWGTNA